MGGVNKWRKGSLSKERERERDDDDVMADPALLDNGSTINAALEAARDIKSPIIIQFSNGGSAFVAGKGLSNKNQEASVIGAVAGAQVDLYYPTAIMNVPFYALHVTKTFFVVCTYRGQGVWYPCCHSF